MSLIFTLASRNLFQDRLRFIASLLGIVFSVVLVMVQMGLYFGFGRMVTTMINHASTDLWIVSIGAKYFEDLSLLDTGMRERLLAVDGVAEVIPVVVGFSAWSLPDGTMTPVFIVGSDFTTGVLSLWNVVEGTIQSLAAPGRVSIDQLYFDRLGVSSVGATALVRGLPVMVGAVTAGIRSFTPTPYVFSDLGAARSYIGLPEAFTSQFLVRLQPGANIEGIRQSILSHTKPVAGRDHSTFDGGANHSDCHHVHHVGNCGDTSRLPRRSRDCVDPMTEPIIEAANVSKIFGSGPARMQALNDVNLSLHGAKCLKQRRAYALLTRHITN